MNPVYLCYEEDGLVDVDFFGMLTSKSNCGHREHSGSVEEHRAS